MNKRYTALMTTLIFSVLFSISASAYDVEVDGIFYNLNTEEKSAEVTFKVENDGSYEGNIVLPSIIVVDGNEYSVSNIGHRAFEASKNLSSISIPKSVTSIGNSAFSSCIGLTSVTIPNSVISIGNDAFGYCSGLTSVSISNSLTSIGDYAFRNCSGLTSVTIPNSVTSIGSNAFYNCTGLTSITIPNSVTSIGDNAFRFCNGITQTIIINDMFVFLPKDYTGHYSISNNITKIVGGAFANCERLTSITIPNSVTSIGNGAFWGCNGLTSVTIPNSITSIIAYAFAYCDGLTSVTIPNSVTSIDYYAFEGSYNVKTLNIDCSIETWIRPDIEELFYGDNIDIVYDYYRNMHLRKISLGKNVSQIRAEAFASSNIEEFTITGEEPPYLYPNVFGTQDLSNATLYVLESKTEYYQTTEPWSQFGKILTLSGDTPSEPEKCATPSISFSEGQLLFSCETEGAKCYYTLNNSDVKTGETLAESKIVNLSACYDITCYAKAEGFVNSDVATAKLYWLTSSGSLEGAGINNVSMRGIAIQSAAGFVTISGLDNNETVSFYGIDGKSLGSATAINGTTSFAAQSGSIVVAKIGKESIKVSVK